MERDNAVRGQAVRITLLVAIDFARVSIVPHKAVNRADPDEPLTISHNVGSDLVRREAIGCCQAVEVEDGEELLLCGEGLKTQEQKCERQAFHAESAASMEMVLREFLNRACRWC
jgi:hypothetical protein